MTASSMATDLMDMMDMEQAKGFVLRLLENMDGDTAGKAVRRELIEFVVPDRKDIEGDIRIVMNDEFDLFDQWDERYEDDSYYAKAMEKKAMYHLEDSLEDRYGGMVGMLLKYGEQDTLSKLLRDVSDSLRGSTGYVNDMHPGIGDIMADNIVKALQDGDPAAAFVIPEED